MYSIPERLEYHQLRLELLEDRHLEGLRQAALNPRIWEFMPYSLLNEASFEKFISQVRKQAENNTRLLYPIIHKQKECIIGASSLMHPDEDNLKIEIADTWLMPEYWGTGLHAETKFLLMEFCFSENDMARIEFKPRENNTRANLALQHLGARKEGILRWDRLQQDGSLTNSVVYSIIRPEWPGVRMKLKSIIKHKKEMKA